jgi:hypothetical protein
VGLERLEDPREREVLALVDGVNWRMFMPVPK